MIIQLGSSPSALLMLLRRGEHHHQPRRTHSFSHRRLGRLGVIYSIVIPRDGGTELIIRFAKQGVLVVFVDWPFLKETMAVPCHVNYGSQCDDSYEWTIVWHTN